MGNLVVNCKYDLGPFWDEEMNSMIGTIRSMALLSECDVEINSIKRSGCDLLVNCAFPTKEVDISKTFLDGELIYAVEGIISCFTNNLRTICPKCGKDKGEPPSTTVRPGLCQECRSKLTPNDFKGCTIVGLIGKAGAGKDTVADHLVEKHGYQRVALADPLRDIVQLVFVLDRDSVWDRKLRELPLKFLIKWTVRKLLQFIGTELFRNLVWDETWMYNLSQRLEPGTNYVCTDVRFPNEMNGLKECFGGKTAFVEVVRNGCDGVVGIPGHESESHTFKADVVLDNNGTLADLYAHVDALVDSFTPAPTEEKVAKTA